MDADELQRTITQARQELEQVFKRFAEANPDVPAPYYMAALGEMLVQFSVAHIGPQLTGKFLQHMQDVVERSFTTQ